MTGYVENDALRPWSELGYRTMQEPFSARDLAAAVERAMRHPKRPPFSAISACHCEDRSDAAISIAVHDAMEIASLCSQ